MGSNPTGLLYPQGGPVACHTLINIKYLSIEPRERVSYSMYVLIWLSADVVMTDVPSGVLEFLISTQTLSYIAWSHLPFCALKIIRVYCVQIAWSVIWFFYIRGVANSYACQAQPIVVIIYWVILHDPDIAELLVGWVKRWIHSRVEVMSRQ